jgi:hypothetical protein
MSFVAHQSQQIDHQGASDNAIPESLMSSRVPKPVPSMNRVISIPSQSGNASQSGQIVIQIAGGSNSNGYCRSGSAYLRAVVTVSKTAGGNADNLLSFANQSKSASSLINRLQISANGTQLETINRYDNWHALVQSQGCNANYVNNDSSITEYANTDVVTGVATSATFNIAIPLFSGILSNAKSFPLFLSGLMLQFDLNSAALAFKSSGTSATFGLSYVVSQAELVYESINPDQSLLDGIRMSMAQSGRLFELPYSTPLGLTTATTAAQASFSYNVGLNLASVSGVFIAEVEQAVETAVPTAGTATTVPNNFIRNSTEAQTNSRRFYLDGKQMVNYDVWADSQNFNETQRALGSLLSLDNTTIATRANYCAAAVGAGAYYIVGQSGRRFAESDLCMAGSPCSNLVIQLAKSGTPVASSMYIYVLYDGVAVLDANGSCAVAK